MQPGAGVFTTTADRWLYSHPSEPDVHFAHARGFVAKTSAADPLRLSQLLEAARV